MIAQLRRWWCNPWGEPRFLRVFVWGYIAWSLLPVFIALAFGFNDGRSRSTWQGFSLRWYFTDPDLAVWTDPSLLSALIQSLKLAVATMFIATPIGVGLALGLARGRGRGFVPANFLMLLPLATPELIMGVSLFMVFVYLFPFIELGTQAQIIGHVTFTISYVVIVVRGRLFAIGRDYEEAAMDLGATPLQAIRLVLLPLLAPAIFASLMIAFAVSIDDFVISAFLAGGQSSATIPVRLYSAARMAPTPALNALASLLLLFTVLAVVVAALFMRRSRKNSGNGASMVEEVANLT